MNNKNFMSYKYTNSSVEITISDGEKVLMMIDACRALMFSSGRPWQTTPMHYDLVEATGDLKSACVTMYNEKTVVKMNFHLIQHGMIHVEVEWKNTSEEEIKDVALGIIIPIKKSEKEKITIPGVIYNNNPSTESYEEIPKISQDGGFITEEHRLPIPCVNIENIEKENFYATTLFSLPSECALNKEDDNEWSIGVFKNAETSNIALFSGVLMAIGETDIVYGAQNKFFSYERGYFDMQPDETVKKSFTIYKSQCPREGMGFKDIVYKGYEIYRPNNQPEMNINKQIELRSNALANRYYEKDGVFGYLYALEGEENGNVYHEPPMFKCGLTGQDMRAAWCDAANSLRIRNRIGIQHARDTLNFFVRTSPEILPGLREICYDVNKKEWFPIQYEGQVSSRAYGEMLCSICDIVELFKEHWLDVPESWVRYIN